MARTKRATARPSVAQPTTNDTDWRALAAEERLKREEACSAAISAALEKYRCEPDPYIEITSKGIRTAGFRIVAID